MIPEETHSLLAANPNSMWIEEIYGSVERDTLMNDIPLFYSPH